MGRTLPSITQAFLHEQQALGRFRRALRLEDQRALDHLLASARQHLAASAYASHLLPFEVMLLAMLVEEHKQMLHLEGQLADMRRVLEGGHPNDGSLLGRPTQTEQAPPDIGEQPPEKDAEADAQRRDHSEKE